MRKLIKNINVNYELYGEGNDTIVLLHGWGQNIEMMKPIGDNLRREHQILIIDLPGFGLSDEPDFPWTLYDYVEMLKEMIESLKLKNIILMGHSFGGKISLLYASMYPVKKIVVFGSPYKCKVAKDNLKTRTLKKLKKIPGLNKLEEFAKKHIGSTDYKNASPMTDAYELEKLVPGSGLVVYPNCTHYAYLENLGQTINVLRSFLGG